MSFSITQAQYEALLARVTALELQANDQAVAMDRLVSLAQVNEISVLLQSKIESLDIQVQALEARVTALEEEPLT